MIDDDDDPDKLIEGEEGEGGDNNNGGVGQSDDNGSSADNKLYDDDDDIEAELGVGDDEEVEVEVEGEKVYTNGVNQNAADNNDEGNQDSALKRDDIIDNEGALRQAKSPSRGNTSIPSQDDNLHTASFRQVSPIKSPEEGSNDKGKGGGATAHAPAVATADAGKLASSTFGGGFGSVATASKFGTGGFGSNAFGGGNKSLASAGFGGGSVSATAAPSSGFGSGAFKNATFASTAVGGFSSGTIKLGSIGGNKNVVDDDHPLAVKPIGVDLNKNSDSKKAKEDDRDKDSGSNDDNDDGEGEGEGEGDENGAEKEAVGVTYNVPKVKLEHETPIDRKHNGEENESTAFEVRVKLYKIVDKQYREVGVGPLRLKAPLSMAPFTVVPRLVMRRESHPGYSGTKLVLNSPLYPSMMVEQPSELSCQFSGTDIDGKMAIFLVRAREVGHVAKLIDEIRRYKNHVNFGKISQNKAVSKEAQDVASANGVDAADKELDELIGDEDNV